MLIYDHARRTLKILVFEPEGEKNRAEEAMRSIKERLRAELPGEEGGRRRHPAPVGPVSNISRERFMEAVCRAKEYIRAGEIFQVVLSQRFRQEISADPFSVYRV
ncbi:MAG: chorismate-binding protein, partial [Thermacetogeniaceae bacterium]